MSAGTMHGFIERHGAEGIFRRWVLEKDVRDFLHLSVGGGVVLADVLTGHGVHDTISPQLWDACQNLMREKAGSADQLCDILVDKMMLGDAATLGYINKIKGQVGEDVFLESAQQAGFSARLADLGNQEAWDVAVTSKTDGLTEYVQVKTMASPDNVLGHMQTVADKLAAGKIMDGNIPVHDITFAVPDDIYDAVVQKAVAAGLPTKITSFPLSAQDAAQVVQDGFDNVAYFGIGNALQQLAGGMLTAAVLHTLVHAYLLHKGACRSEVMLKKVGVETALSGGGIAAALGMETLLKSVGVATGSLPAVAVIMATALSVRGMLRRIALRSGYKIWLEQENMLLRQRMMPLALLPQV